MLQIEPELVRKRPLGIVWHCWFDDPGLIVRIELEKAGADKIVEIIDHDLLLPRIAEIQTTHE